MAAAVMVTGGNGVGVAGGLAVAPLSGRVRKNPGLAHWAPLSDRSECL